MPPFAVGAMVEAEKWPGSWYRAKMADTLAQSLTRHSARAWFQWSADEPREKTAPAPLVALRLLQHP